MGTYSATHISLTAMQAAGIDTERVTYSPVIRPPDTTVYPVWTVNADPFTRIVVEGHKSGWHVTGYLAFDADDPGTEAFTYDVTDRDRLLGYLSQWT